MDDRYIIGKLICVDPGSDTTWGKYLIKGEIYDEMSPYTLPGSIIRVRSKDKSIDGFVNRKCFITLDEWRINQLNIILDDMLI